MWAISSALPLRRSRMVLFIVLSDILRARGLDLMASVMSVSMNHGWMTLQRIPESGSRYAADLDSPSSSSTL
ncbi:hypothetical protein ABGB18_32265 [Nonomuraea sp. B12E4]|uniref:hypothetical protein n=1 Tax=Nonomuraea sp. B12E4 TaxID=3153564 RepID=UPI00325D7188